jgi:hypothetical protein
MFRLTNSLAGLLGCFAVALAAPAGAQTGETRATSSPASESTPSLASGEGETSAPANIDVPNRAAADAASPPKGLSSSDWSSICAAYEAGRHRFFAVEGGWTARTPAQGLSTTFDGRGFTTQPDADGWSWGLDLQGYGWGDTTPVTEPRGTSTDGGRFSREWDNVLTEWYVNDSRGLEHGFTVASRPSGAAAPLTVELSIRGGLQPVVSPDGRDVAFTDAQGVTALNYNGLTVLDAAGKTVPATWYTICGDRLRLQVDDAAAPYPLSIDPVVQTAYLKASNTEVSDGFGCSVAVSGDTVVVGAFFEDSSATGVNGNQADNSASASGAAYVFVRSGGVWSQQAYLKASNTGVDHQFGNCVAISGDTVVVASQSESSSATGVDGNQADNSAQLAGAAYVFVRSGGVWSQQAYLKASNTGQGDRFGWSVAVSGDTLVVGAYAENSSATGVDGNQADNSAGNSGAAYVFVRLGGVWSQQAYLKASNSGAGDFFGYSVAVSGNTVVVGAQFEDSNATGVNGDQANNSSPNVGAAYVFVRSGGVWSQQAYLKASNTQAGDQFGECVAISGDMVVVGAYYEDSNATGVNGNQANNSASGSGAAYVFVRLGGVWSQQAYLKASNTAVGDAFGDAVAISGDTVVVGAWLEDSNATGVNGNQASNSAVKSGAAYIFDLDNDPGTVSFGTGTPGCAGTQVLDVTHPPMVNSPSFGITCSNAPPLSAGFGVLATGQDLLGSDLFGLGVLLHIDPLSPALFTIPFSSDAFGNALAPAPIPNKPTLIGQTLYAQVLWAWTSCPLPPFGLSTSNGLALTFLAP